uniref:Uncharacterized protein n=1 Tax=Anguilla anguilla TaxID=7936 RepID=A0A0E9TE95_ANGAN
MQCALRDFLIEIIVSFFFVNQLLILFS